MKCFTSTLYVIYVHAHTEEVTFNET